MVDALLDELVAGAREAFGADLIAVVLFGSAAEGRLRKTSDVNVIAVTRRFDPAEFEEKYAAQLPERISGEAFLTRYKGTADPVTSIDPSWASKVALYAWTFRSYPPIPRT